MDNKSTSYLNPAAIVSMDMRDSELADVIKSVEHKTKCPEKDKNEENT